MTNRVISMTGVSKRFGPVLALDSVDFHLEVGEIHALLGMNGAGKSTLVKILSGIYRKDAGRLEIKGREVELADPREAIATGIATVQQHPELVPRLSGHENIFLGREGADTRLFRRLDRRTLFRRTAALLQRLGLALPAEIDLNRLVCDMPAVDREIVAILRAVSQPGISVLILDEPTSVLTEKEKELLFSLMRSLKAGGIAIVYITHRLEEVFEITDCFTVFRGGRNVATLRSDEARRRQVSIANLMLGETAGHLFPDRKPVAGEILLEVRELSLPGAFDDISFEARSGEIVGIFGLVGSGLDELSKTIFGVLRPRSGLVRIGGRTRRIRSPGQALRQGVFLVPGDRHAEGLFAGRDVLFNLTAANLGRASWPGGLLRWRGTGRIGRRLAEQVALTPPALDRAASTYSGGNQQKIVIAKGLFAEASVYLFVEPTVGVDIAARARIYGLMQELSRHAAVVVLSSDSDEVHGLADRVIALYRGRKTLDGPVERFSRDDLLMAGLAGGLER